MVDNFKQLGDIDAAAIVKAAHSSSDLAQSLEIADFNAGGLSLALQGVASGAISQSQITDSLLGVLSDISAIESNSAVAFDAMNNLKLSDSVYKLGQNYGKIAKQMYSIEKAGNVMDAPLLEGYELFFDEEVRERYEEARGQLNRGEITQAEFDKIMADEKKALTGLAKNGNFASLWEYAFKKAGEEFVRVEEKDEEVVIVEEEEIANSGVKKETVQKNAKKSQNVQATVKTVTNNESTTAVLPQTGVLSDNIFYIFNIF